MSKNLSARLCGFKKEPSTSFVMVVFRSSSPHTLSHPICASCRLRLRQRPPQTLYRSITSSSHHLAENDDEASTSSSPKTFIERIREFSNRPNARAATVSRGSRTVRVGGQQRKPQGFQTRPDSATGAKAGRTAVLNDLMEAFVDEKDAKDKEASDPRTPDQREFETAYHFHVYATKHNTHITLTDPKRDPVISLSAGNLGFRKANRGTFDAAYQLAVYVLGRIKEQGLDTKIPALEVILRGFGVGREAVSKSLMGVEGQAIRGAIRRISDGTRLKFGGTRSRKIRRLG